MVFSQRFTDDYGILFRCQSDDAIGFNRNYFTTKDAVGRKTLIAEGLAVLKSMSGYKAKQCFDAIVAG